MTSHPHDDTNLADQFDRRLAAGEGNPYQLLHDLLGANWHGGDPRTWEGQQRGGFLFERLLGIGGMGATFAARDEGQIVAIKVVSAVEGAAAQRFTAECEMLASLNHPGIVRYLRHGLLPDGHGYLEMELLEGRDLQHVLDDLAQAQCSHPVTAAILGDAEAAKPHADEGFRRRVLRIAAMVADGLHHAHERGIVHRDLKPGNVLLQNDLSPRLLDFGLGLDLFRHLSFTRSSALVGTVPYMAPEQLRGAHSEVDARTDVFALGLLLYRCLCGGEFHTSLSKALDSVRERILVRHRDVAHLPEDVQAILFKSLDPGPERRYPTAAAQAEDLRAVAEHRPVQARVPGGVQRFLRSRRGRRVLGSTLVTAMALGMVLWIFWPRYVLTVDALFDLADCTVLIDGEETDYVLPARDIPTAPGWHRIEYRITPAAKGEKPRALPIAQDFLVEDRFTRVTLLNPFQEWTTNQEFTESPPEEAAFLQVLSLPGTELFFEDERIEEGLHWLLVPPGPHRIRAQSASGLVESQEIDLAPATLHPTLLLTGLAAEIPGSYRRTLGTAISPLPSDVSLKLENGAARFLNNFQDFHDPTNRQTTNQFVSRTHISTHTYVTATEPGRDAVATLRVEFPETMRSAVFQTIANVKSNQYSMRLDYRTDRGAWREITEPRALTGAPVIIQVEGIETGATVFELRAVMSTPQRAESFVPLHFLAAYADQDKAGGTPDTCFSIVADPDPDVARLPR